MSIDYYVAFFKQPTNSVEFAFGKQSCNEVLELLEELKMRRKLDKEQRKVGNIEGYNKGYNKVIDDFAKACKDNILCQTFGLKVRNIDEIAEQLKAGGENES